MGAWIEINRRRPYPSTGPVAPFMGAWIEIMLRLSVGLAVASLPSWERGLKSHHPERLTHGVLSLPSWERGLKSGIDPLPVALVRRSLHGSVD